MFVVDEFADEGPGAGCVEFGVGAEGDGGAGCVCAACDGCHRFTCFSPGVCEECLDGVVVGFVFFGFADAQAEVDACFCQFGEVFVGDGVLRGADCCVEADGQPGAALAYGECGIGCGGEAGGCVDGEQECGVFGYLCCCGGFGGCDEDADQLQALDGAFAFGEGA